MILAPINSITSVNFYKKVAGQSLGRTFLYLSYLGLLFSIVFIIFLKTRIWPAFQETFQWLAASVPAVTYANGRLSTPTNEPVTLRHPRLDTVAFTLDTGRTEPVAPQMLRDNKVVAYVTANAMYIMQPGGKVEVYDFSRSPSAKPVVFDAKFYGEIARALAMVLYPLGFLACFCLFLLWKIIAALFYSLIALIINGINEAGLEYKSLFNISAYAQTFVVAVQAILLLVPAQVPLLTLGAIVVTTAYIWLALKRIAVPQPQVP
jgi:hypothetical protein